MKRTDFVLVLALAGYAVSRLVADVREIRRWDATDVTAVRVLSWAEALEKYARQREQAQTRHALGLAPLGHGGGVW